VSDGSGNIFLTRNGSFTSDSQGYLVNSGGYYLMAAPTTNATAANQSVNSESQLQRVNVSGSAETASPSTTATMALNLPSTATAVSAANLPSTNSASSQYTNETTLTAYDDLGGSHTIDLYFTNTGSNTWEVDAYDASTAANGGAFPYSSGPLATATLNFDATTGALSSGSPVSIPIPGGEALSLNLNNATQLASNFGITSTTINGNAPGTMDGVSISNTGVMAFNYSNGSTSDAYIVPLGTVASPDNLSTALGDAYQTSSSSGSLEVNNAQSGGLGAIESSSLESSTVDLATELTNMIQAQSAYEANSKVFQTGTNIFDILNKLQA
jgi:flagellar hook protein FlgE